MPVARRRGRYSQLRDIVLVEDDSDSDYDSDDDEYPQLPISTARPTITSNPYISMSTMEKQAQPTSDDNDPIRITMTMTQSGQVTGTALAASSNDPTETVVVTIPPPPPHHNYGISQTTEHLLIAAASIGATIVVVMIFFALHTMRKRGITFAEAIKRGKNAAYRKSHRGPPPPPKGRNWATPAHTWDRNEQFEQSSVKGFSAIATPAPAMTRSGSESSDRPLILQRNASFDGRPSTRSTSPGDPGSRSFLLDSPPRPSRNTSRNHGTSETLSSPLLPTQNQLQNTTMRNTLSMSSISDLQYPEPPVGRMEPVPPPPSFRQFLFNRRSVAQPRGGGAMVSRFSWTNSNAPQTPHDPTRDTYGNAPPGISRDSYMTSRSSVPRFRTIDSWVNQQASRFEEQKLRDQLHTQGSALMSQSEDERENDIPDVPVLPLNITKLRTDPNGPPPSASIAMPGLVASGLVSHIVKHERHDTSTTVTEETAPIFRQHPGNEVRFSTRSLVPSEILNSKMRASVL